MQRSMGRQKQPNSEEQAIRQFTLNSPQSLQPSTGQASWKLNYDILVYILDWCIDDRQTLVAFVSTCHSLREAGIRRLAQCRTYIMSINPDRLLSFCAFMVVDFPSRCKHLQQLDLRSQKDHLQLQHPTCLRFFPHIVANSLNVTSAFIESSTYARLAKLVPEMHAAFCSGQQRSLRELYVTMGAETSSSMIDYLRGMKLPALAKLSLWSSPLFPSIVAPFRHTIRELLLNPPPRTPVPCGKSWQPCPKVTDLILQHYPWYKLDLEWLVHTFPNLRVLEMYDYEEMGEYRSNRRVQNLGVRGWSSLDRIVGDLNYIYALGLNCEVREMEDDDQVPHDSHGFGYWRIGRAVPNPEDPCLPPRLQTRCIIQDLLV
ncbi:hypothetical protein K474DRAFT_618369 [Panus rudis PR-1116 ss-1]|nr:hypothetical protein K474DRAFT_618369 [Panus rudis PR-1116 ss-1]